MWKTIQGDLCPMSLTCPWDIPWSFSQEHRGACAQDISHVGCLSLPALHQEQPQVTLCGAWIMELHIPWLLPGLLLGRTWMVCCRGDPWVSEGGCRVVNPGRGKDVGYGSHFQYRRSVHVLLQQQRPRKDPDQAAHLYSSSKEVLNTFCSLRSAEKEHTCD